MIPSARVVRLGIRAARVLPASMLYPLARLAGRVAWALLPARRAVVHRNLAHLGADHAHASEVLPNLMEAAIDLWRLPSLTPEAVRGLVQVEGIEHLERARTGGRGVILATGHLGPYELAGAWLAAQGFPVHAMVEGLQPETTAALAAYRTATGMKLIDRGTGTRAVLRALRAGDVVALVCDRMVGEGAPGLHVPMGDTTREIPTGPASLSVATGAPVVTGHIRRREESGPRYVIALDPPLSPEGQDVDGLTRAIGARLDATLRQYPTQWYVFQPAWREDQLVAS